MVKERKERQGDWKSKSKEPMAQDMPENINEDQSEIWEVIRALSKDEGGFDVIIFILERLFHIVW